jgi:hypothetical protein
MNAIQNYKQTRINSKKKIILTSTLLMPVHCNARSWLDFQLFCAELQRVVGGDYHD